MIKFLQDGWNPSQKADYSYCSEKIRELLDILNGKYEIKVAGQEEMNERIVMAMVLNEHILIEGLPGTAKTTAIKNLADEMGLFFNRVQFIPDMQPSDLVGKRDLKMMETDGKEQFRTRWVDGPLFANFLLADEINRAPSRVQAALLEAMGEKQITPFGQDSKIIRCQDEFQYLKHDHTPPFASEKIDLSNKKAVQFNVFATMNPIEMEGTYPLSEAQIDRFCFKTVVYYPNMDVLHDISMKVLQDYEKSFRTTESEEKSDQEKKEDMLTGLYFLRECRKRIFEKDKDGSFKHIKKEMIQKISNIIYFSHFKGSEDGDGIHSDSFVKDPKQLEIKLNILKKQNNKARELLKFDLFRYIDSGSSPRGQENLIKASLAQAFMEGDQVVNEKHIEKVIYDVLRHRIRVNIQAKTLNIDSIDVINELMDIFL
jgi:MoxR-like ATPase